MTNYIHASFLTNVDVSSLQAFFCRAAAMDTSHTADLGSQDDADDISLFEVSEDSDVISEFDGRESPHHRAWKFPRLAAFASVEQLSTCSPQTFTQWLDEEQHALNNFAGDLASPSVAMPAPARVESENLSRVYNGFTRSLEAWPNTLSTSTEVRPLFFQQHTRFAWGGCPEHPTRSLQPRVAKDGDWAGSVRLFCSGGHDFSYSGHRKCLVSFPFPETHFHKLPIRIREEAQTVANSLLRGSRSR